MAKRFLLFSEKMACKYADEIITDNRILKEYVKIRYNRDSRLIEYGADHVAQVQKKSKDAIRYPFLNKKCIEPENNIHVILEAFSKLPYQPFVLVGNWNNSQYGKDLKARFGKFKHIYLLDPIYQSEELNLLRSNAHFMNTKQLKKLVEKGKYKQTFKEITNLLEINSQSDDAIEFSKMNSLLSSRFETVIQDRDKGTISKEEEYRVRNQIVEALINLIDKIDEAEIGISKFISNLKGVEIQDRVASFFSGKQDYLSRLNSLVNKPDKNFFYNLVIGMPGVGKTLLAQNVAYNLSKKSTKGLQLVWYFNSESIDVSFRTLSEELGIEQSKNPNEIKAEIINRLNSKINSWLLVYDNACDYATRDEIKKFKKDNFPELSSNKQIIITSRNKRWTDEPFIADNFINMKEWLIEDYKEYLSKNGVRHTDEQLEKLYGEFGGLPLAITQAVSYIKEEEITLSEYLSELQKSKEQHLASRMEDYDNISVINAISLAYNNLNSEAVFLLSLYSFLAPDDIPSKHIAECIVNDHIRNEGYDNKGIRRGNTQLIKYSLVRWSDDTNSIISIHRLVIYAVQVILREKGEEYHNYLKQIISVFDSLFDLKDKISSKNKLYYQELVPHIVNILKIANKGHNLSPTTAYQINNLKYKLGIFYWRFGEPQKALDMFENALNSLSGEQAETVLLKNRVELFISDVLIREGVERAPELYEIYARITPALNSNPELMEDNILYWLATVYYELGDYDTTIEKLKKSIAVEDEEDLMSKPTATMLIGQCYGLKSDYKELKKNILEAADSFEKIGEKRNHTYIWYYLIAFGFDLEIDNDISDWLAKFRKNADLLKNDARYKCLSKSLNLRMAVRENSEEDAYIAYQKLNEKMAAIKKYTVANLEVSAYLDYLKFLYDKGNNELAMNVLSKITSMIGNLPYHRQDEVDDFKQKLL